LFVHCPGNADPARLGERLQTRRDIDPVAEDVAALDKNVAEIDPDAEPDAPLFGQLHVPVAHAALQLGGERIASTTLANSTSKPSPVVLTMRPR